MNVLLHIQPSGLSIHDTQSRGDKTHCTADAEGFALFCRWLDHNRKAIVYVCIDHPHIECHHEPAPVLRGREKQSYLEILCDRLCPDGHLISVQMQKGNVTAEQLVLATTLTDDRSIVPWLELLEQRRALVATVCFLPNALAGLKSLKRRGVNHILLVGADSFGGFRLSLYRESALLLNRHVGSMDVLATEARRTLQFAQKSELIDRVENGLVMLCEAEGAEVISTTDELLNSDGPLEISGGDSTLSPTQIPEIFRAIRKAQGWRGVRIDSRYKSMRAAQRILAAGLLLVLFGISTLVVRSALVNQYNSLFAIADNHRLLVKEQLAALNAHEVSVESGIATVEFVTAIQADVTRTPLRSLSWLAGVLQHRPAIQLLALQWQHASHPKLVVVGQVDEQVGGLVDGVSTFTDLVEAFQNNEFIRADVSKAPFGLGTQAADTARVSANLDDRDFRIELSFEDQWWGDDNF